MLIVIKNAFKFITVYDDWLKSCLKLCVPDVLQIISVIGHLKSIPHRGRIRYCTVGTNVCRL